MTVPSADSEAEASRAAALTRVRREVEFANAFVETFESMVGVEALTEALVALRDMVLGGRDRRLTFSELIETEELDAAAEILTRLSAGDPSPDSVLTVAEDLASWLERNVAVVEHKLSPKAAVARHEFARIEHRIRLLKPLARMVRAERDIRQQHREVNAVAREAAESVSDARELVGDAAASELGRDFARYATAESDRSLRWSAVVIAMLAAASTLSLILIVQRPTGSFAEELARVAASLPLVAIAIYSARVAGHHRATAHWAHTKAVQLQSIRAYSDALDEEARMQLRLELGRQVFAPAAGSEVEATATPVVVDPNKLLDQVSDVLKSTLDAVRGMRT